jgi:hypothetical protein
MQLTSSATNHPKQGGGVKLQRSDAVLLAALLIGFNLLTFVLVQRGNSDLEKGDFKMFYSAAVALRSGHSGHLYEHDLYVQSQRQLLPSLPLQDVKVYTHPPYELLIFWPLSYLSYTAACYCWIGITLLLAVLCGRLLGGYAAVLGLFPLLVTLLEQQDSVLALLILISCWLALRKGCDERAGLLLGLALFRFQLVLPLALVLLFWKPRLLRGFALSATLVVALSLAMVGPSGLRSYVGYMSAMGRDSSAAVIQHGYIVDPRTNPTLRGLVYELAGRVSSASSTSTRILPAAVVLLDLLCLAFAWKFMRTDAPPEAKFAFAVLVGLVLSFYLLTHDLVLLALPFVLLRGLPARWPLIPFYLAPLIYICFYPHSQAWLALLLVFSSFLIVFPKGLRSPAFNQDTL